MPAKIIFGARHLGARILDVFLEYGLAPGDPGSLVLVEAFNGARLAAQSFAAGLLIGPGVHQILRLLAKPFQLILCHGNLQPELLSVSNSERRPGSTSSFAICAHRSALRR
jgi:hypothetical protein